MHVIACRVHARTSDNVFCQPCQKVSLATMESQSSVDLELLRNDALKEVSFSPRSRDFVFFPC